MSHVRSRLRAALALIAWAWLATPSSRQAPAHNSDLLTVEPQDDLGLGWKIDRVELTDNFSGSTALLRIEKLSQAAEDITFYGEFFDGSNRLCFSLVFSQERNLEGRTGPLGTGEIRTLSAGTHYLAPAARPASVKLFGIRGPKGPAPAGRQQAVCSPVTDEGSTLPERDDKTLWLGSELDDAPGPFLDLALARVTVGKQGDLKRAEVLAALSDAVQEWTMELLEHQEFRARQCGGIPEDGDALVLLRALISLRCLHQKPFPPRDCPLVAEHVASLGGREIPPLITLLLERAPEKYGQLLSSAGFYSYSGVGAGWSAQVGTGGAVAHGGDRSARGPVLRRIVPPPESYSCP